MLDDTLIDASTVHINKVGDVYKAGYSDFNVKFCGIDISFSQKNSNIKIYIIFCMINIYLHISVIKLLNYYLKNTPVSASII